MLTNRQHLLACSGTEHHLQDVNASYACDMRPRHADCMVNASDGECCRPSRLSALVQRFHMENEALKISFENAKAFHFNLSDLTCRQREEFAAEPNIDQSLQLCKVELSDHICNECSQKNSHTTSSMARHNNPPMGCTAPMFSCDGNDEQREWRKHRILEIQDRIRLRDAKLSERRQSIKSTPRKWQTFECVD